MCFRVLLFYSFVSCVTTQQASMNTWSMWKDCTGIKRCYHIRELECGKNRGLNCTNPGQNGIAFEQQLCGPTCYEFEHVILSNKTSLNCRPSYNPGYYECYPLVFPRNDYCEGECYDAVRRVSKTCSGGDVPSHIFRLCGFTEHQRCYNPQQCLGTWSNWSPVGGCSVSCGGGIVNETRECRDLNGTGKYEIVGNRLSFVY